MKNLVISTLLIFGFAATTVYADTDVVEEAAVENSTVAKAKSKAKKDDYKVVCRRVKVTGSNRTEKSCRRVSASTSDAKKKK